MATISRCYVYQQPRYYADLPCKFTIVHSLLNQNKVEGLWVAILYKVFSIHPSAVT